MRVKEGFFIYDILETIEAIFCFLAIIFVMIMFAPILIYDAIKQRSLEKKNESRTI
jgi:hypothetical protein